MGDKTIGFIVLGGIAAVMLLVTSIGGDREQKKNNTTLCEFINAQYVGMGKKGPICLLKDRTVVEIAPKAE